MIYYKKCSCLQPGGHFICLPPRTCKWRWYTDWPGVNKISKMAEMEEMLQKIEIVVESYAYKHLPHCWWLLEILQQYPLFQPLFWLHTAGDPVSLHVLLQPNEYIHSSFYCITYTWAIKCPNTVWTDDHKQTPSSRRS